MGRCPPMENGSIVHIDYDLYNADDEELIETTREEVAKKAEKYDENRAYKPLVTVIGDGKLIAGFETHLGEAEAETDYEFDIPPEDAYGQPRDRWPGRDQRQARRAPDGARRSCPHRLQPPARRSHPALQLPHRQGRRRPRREGPDPARDQHRSRWLRG
ncbi:MAG TPA: hypothetical protein EYQ80_03565 [Candidatus Poseidoniales archaeon]|nr:hypothetical protein [Candidatus Poseidoniales archaeon]